MLIAFPEIICKGSHEKKFRLDLCLRKIVPCRDIVAVEMSLHTSVCPGMLMTMYVPYFPAHMMHCDFFVGNFRNKKIQL
jgi:hypothetical protein